MIDVNHQARRPPSPKVLADTHKEASEKTIQQANISINEPTPYAQDMRISAPFPGIRYRSTPQIERVLAYHSITRFGNHGSVVIIRFMVGGARVSARAGG